MARNRYRGRSRYRPHRGSFRRKKPLHQTILGVILILISFVLIKIGFILSKESGEAGFWIILIAVIIFFFGIFTIIAWWRNNVATMNTRHAVTWRNR